MDKKENKEAKTLEQIRDELVYQKDIYIANVNKINGKLELIEQLISDRGNDNKEV